MPALATLLTHSIVQYEGILAWMQQMDAAVGTADADALAHFSDGLQGLQGEAAADDQMLLAQLADKGPAPESTRMLAARRDSLLREILALNQRLTEKAARVQALLSHEIKSLGNGLTALNGYKQPQHNQGRFVNGAS